MFEAYKSVKRHIVIICLLFPSISFAFAEDGLGEHSDVVKNFVKQALKSYCIPWEDAQRSYLQGDYIYLKGSPYFVKEVEKNLAEELSIYQAISSKQEDLETEALFTAIPPAFIEHLGSLAMVKYANTADSFLTPDFKIFQQKLTEAQNLSDTKKKVSHELKDLQTERQNLINGAPSLGNYIKSELLKDLKKNTGTLGRAAALHFIISSLTDLTSSYHQKKVGTDFCYTVSPKGQAFILQVQSPSEAEAYLFSGIEKHGRIHEKEFKQLQEQGCSIVGGKVVPRRSLKTRSRDALAFTLGKAAEITLDTAFAMIGQHRDLLNTPALDLEIRKKTENDNYILAPKPMRLSDSFKGAVAGIPGFLGYAATTFAYLSVKNHVKHKVTQLYRKHFPKYDLKEVAPKEPPLGIASVDKEFRYIYLDQQNQQCSVEKLKENIFTGISLNI